MARAGLREVADPPRVFLAERAAAAPGRVVAAASRDAPLLVEVQALVAPSARRRRSARPTARREAPRGTARRARRRAGRRRRRAATSSPTRRRPCSSEPGADLGARGGARVVAPRPADRAATRPFGEIGLLGELAASAGSTAGCARPPARVRPGGRAPRHASRSTAASAGIEVVVVGSLAEALRAPSARPSGRRPGAGLAGRAEQRPSRRAC